MPDAGPLPRIDNDGDGYSTDEGDCNDNNASIHPLAPDPCDGIDQNCNNQIDEAYDADLDGATTCQGDCADNDPTSLPGHFEVVDGRDNDCDGIVDNHNDQYDDDGDGWTEDQGDCDDEEKFVNPGAVEVQVKTDGTPELVDNNCDGEVDEATPPCDSMVDQDDPFSFAGAIELCERVTVATFQAPTDARARKIVSDYGNTYVPNVGAGMVALSTGIVADENDPGYVLPQSGTALGMANTIPHPNPGPPTTCGAMTFTDPMDVNDVADFVLEVRAPTNAQSFSFDFNFMSAEYPEFVCTQFDDTFEVLLTSEMFNGNISFDSAGMPVTINVGFFTVTSDTELGGTGFDNGVGGGTGWLTTTAPVTPGEKITLRFILWDEGDHAWDSTVLIDNFRWKLEPIDNPTTEG